jgi:hypothetical protein
MTGHVNILVGIITIGIVIIFRLCMNKLLDNNMWSFTKIHYSEAHPVLFFSLPHTIWQTVLGPQVLHKPFCYLAKVIRNTFKE